MRVVILSFRPTCRRSQHFLRVAQHVCSHRHVLLLHGVGDGTQVPKIHLVEEVSHLIPDGKYSVELTVSALIVCVCVLTVVFLFPVPICVHFHSPVPVVVRRV